MRNSGEKIEFVIFKNPASVVIEEITFRGLLWLFLRRLNILEWKILLLQSVVFLLFHINYVFQSPLAFIITIPVGSFLCGLLVWKSRSLAPSILVHYLYNVFIFIK